MTVPSPLSLAGTDWPNISIVRDFSTRQACFEVHLRIDLDDADANEVHALLVAAHAGSDPSAPGLKQKLIACLGARRNAGTEAIVKAILLKI